MRIIDLYKNKVFTEYNMFRPWYIKLLTLIENVDW